MLFNINDIAEFLTGDNGRVEKGPDESQGSVFRRVATQIEASTENGVIITPVRDSDDDRVIIWGLFFGNTRKQLKFPFTNERLEIEISRSNDWRRK